MGAECSSEKRRDSEELTLNTPKAARPPPVATGGFGFFCSPYRNEDCEVLDQESPNRHRATSSSFAGLDGRLRWERDEEASPMWEEQDDSVERWAPPPEEDEPDAIDYRQWGAMMSAMDQFVLPQEGDSTTASASGCCDTSAASDATPVRATLHQEVERECAMEALREGRPLYTLSMALRSDKDVVLAAIEREGPYCYNYITSESLKQSDRDVVMALVRSDGSLLENCSQELRADRQVVRLALATCSEALKVASKALQGDRELKALALSRAKEEKRLFQQIAEDVCGPGVASACM